MNIVCKSIVIIDDHKLLLNSLEISLKDVFEGKIFSFDSFDSFKHHFNETPDLIITDLCMPGINEKELILNYQNLHLNTPILVMSMVTDSKRIKKLFKLGIKGYVNKSEGIEILYSAIVNLLKGRKFIDESTEKLLTEKISTEIHLTPRELQILILLAQQLNTNQIAEELKLSDHTVKSFRKTLLTKFEVNKTAGMLLKAKELNII